MTNEETYYVCDDVIMLETTDKETLNNFTEKLFIKYEKDFEGAHEVFVRRGDRYFYSHTTWFSRSGEVSSRGVSPQPDQTERFVKEYLGDK